MIGKCVTTAKSEEGAEVDRINLIAIVRDGHD